MKFESIRFQNNQLILIDQRKLPQVTEYFTCTNYKEVSFAIEDMVVRGAPAIGSAAAYGVALAAIDNPDYETFLLRCQEIKNSRPTAVNLMWAVERMIQTIDYWDIKAFEKLLKEADLIFYEDIETNKKMAAYGDSIIKANDVILTHCNTGALATVAYGTALGVIRQAHYSGKNIHVFADETRPRLQGAKLTAWELMIEGIPSTLIADSVAATLIRDGKIDVILVGADRIAANGDTANKIGTFMLSVLAKVYQVPFYIVAPFSTIDFETDTGSGIEIEERDASELSMIGGVQIAPEGMKIFNPAFDVTPFDNITGIITEKGIVYPPLKENLNRLR